MTTVDVPSLSACCVIASGCSYSEHHSSNTAEVSNDFPLLHHHGCEVEVQEPPQIDVSCNSAADYVINEAVDGPNRRLNTVCTYRF